MENGNETSMFLGDRSEWGFIRISLETYLIATPSPVGDILTVEGKTVKVSKAPHHLPPKIVSEFSLSDSEFEGLINTFIENNFMAIEIKKEASSFPYDAKEVTISIVNGRGEEHTIHSYDKSLEKDWKNERFNNIYKHLSELIARANDKGAPKE
jgi:hypothetical protein